MHMSINARYYDYLDHFGQTVTVGELHQDRQSKRLVALRHDVDYDLDFAMEMSHWEHQRGVRATYFLLHTAPYWNDPRLAQKCLQIQEFGHEVGLHVNVLTEWVQGQVSDVGQRLAELLEPLRQAGVRIIGTAAHGDRECYERGFINYWIFRELRPADPTTEESGRTAEGVRVEGEQDRIQYPAINAIKRNADGRRLALWSVSMQQLGLEYHAWHVPHDQYFTDSGGDWNRSDDPLDHPLTSGRAQILMHPIYWRGPQKYYFFLSTARSGSQWLANFLDRATSLTARHEFMLNHAYRDGKLIAAKRTGVNFADLVKDTAEVKDLLGQTRAYMETQSGDQGEANVYLDRFLPTLRYIFPEGIFVHLVRDPKDVVRSVLNRDWYDTPEDRRHPPLPLDGWDRLSRFEKACWYARLTNETLLDAAHRTLVFERMVRDLKYLIEQLRDMGIAVYPRLTVVEHEKKINVGRRDIFPHYDDWAEALVRTYHGICDPILEKLGYGGTRTAGVRIGVIDETLAAILHAGVANATPQLVTQTSFGGGQVPEHLSLVGCRASAVNGSIKIVPDPERHAHVLFAGAAWNRLKKVAGWATQPGHYYRGSLDASIDANEATLFCLMYDRAGDLLEKRSLQLLGPCQPAPAAGDRIDFTFRVRPDAQRFNLALYIPKSPTPANTPRIHLRSLRLEMLPLFDKSAPLALAAAPIWSRRPRSRW